MTPDEVLREGAGILGVALGRDEERLFMLYLSELLKWNAKVNLTAVTEPGEVVVKHFLDSLALLRILESVRKGPLSRVLPPPLLVASKSGVERGRSSGGRSSHLAAPASDTIGAAHSAPALPGESFAFSACDIGSGAGFPGLALKVVLPGMDLTLVEPARKKAAFLRHVARTLGLAGVSVHEARVEALGGEHIGRYDALFSRAFKAPAELLALAGPLLRTGGVAALSLGPETALEVPPGWRVTRQEGITLPFSDYRRTLAAIEKQ